MPPSHEPSRQAWYPLEAARHLAPGGIALGLLFDQEFALWRNNAGVAHVWENRCPHRSVRLTLGLVIGDELACRYHGWRYAPSGQCTAIPAHPGQTPPKAACVRTYACIERNGLVWTALHTTPASAYPELGSAFEPCRSYVLPQAAAHLIAAAVDDGCVRQGEQVLHLPANAFDGATQHAQLVIQPIAANRTGLYLMLDTAHLSAEARIRAQVVANAQVKSRLAAWQRTTAISTEAAHA